MNVTPMSTLFYNLKHLTLNTMYGRPKSLAASASFIFSFSLAKTLTGFEMRRGVAQWNTSSFDKIKEIFDESQPANAREGIQYGRTVFSTLWWLWSVDR